MMVKTICTCDRCGKTFDRLTYYPKDGIPGNPLESSYRVGKYRMKQIYEPKPRIIMALQYRDRVVQWAYAKLFRPDKPLHGRKPSPKDYRRIFFPGSR